MSDELTDAELDDLLRRVLHVDEPPLPTRAELDASFAAAMATAERLAVQAPDLCPICWGDGCDECGYTGEWQRPPTYRLNRPD